MKAGAKKPAVKAAKKRAVRPIPEGHPAVSPYLIVDGADRALAFYRKAFGAKELMRHAGPDGRIGHAEIRIGDSLANQQIHAGHDVVKVAEALGLDILQAEVSAVVRRSPKIGQQDRKPVFEKCLGRIGARNGELGERYAGRAAVQFH